jgi:hypothetical protein
MCAFYYASILGGLESEREAETTSSTATMDLIGGLLLDLKEILTSTSLESLLIEH